jgi:hypothetical protein
MNNLIGASLIFLLQHDRHICSAMEISFKGKRILVTGAGNGE